MNAYFRRQLSRFAEYHADTVNYVMHGVGIPAIFFAVQTALSLYVVPIGNYGIGLGTLLLMPAILLWLALDPVIGGVLLLLIVPLAAAAEWLTRTNTFALSLLIAATFFATGWILLGVGHSVFERRRPAFTDDVSLMFIGPMYIAAKIVVAFGLRKDLIALLEGTASIKSDPVAPGVSISTKR